MEYVRKFVLKKIELVLGHSIEPLHKAWESLRSFVELCEVRCIEVLALELFDFLFQFVVLLL